MGVNDLALTAPGMSNAGADGSWLPSPSAYGSATNENIFLVNGVNTTNPRGASWGSLVKVNYDTVQEVQVKSLGSQAEYGSFSGAAVDVEFTLLNPSASSTATDIGFTDNILTARSISANEDYDVDYFQGRILLAKPISATASDGPCLGMLIGDVVLE